MADAVLELVAKHLRDVLNTALATLGLNPVIRPRTLGLPENPAHRDVVMIQADPTPDDPASMANAWAQEFRIFVIWRPPDSDGDVVADEALNNLRGTLISAALANMRNPTAGLSHIEDAGHGYFDFGAGRCGTVFFLVAHYRTSDTDLFTARP